MIKDLERRINCLPGPITSGIKAVSERTGQEYPKAVDYFVVDDHPEIQASYGEKPKKLIIFAPMNHYKDFLDCDYVLYGSNRQKIRRCDGENCFVRVTHEIDNHTYQAGQEIPCICKELELAEDHKKKCKASFWMKVYVADLNEGRVIKTTPYLFKNNSINSASNIISEFARIENTFGNLMMIPFGLEVEMVAGSTDAMKKFPIWKMRCLVDVPTIEKISQGREMLVPEKKQPKQIQEREIK